MLTEKFHDVLNHEGVVSVVTWTPAEPHITNTWNSYLTVTDDERILIPAAGFTHAENDLAENDQVLFTAGAREVEGRDGYQGTGFRLTGTAKFVDNGAEFEQVKAKYPFIRKVLEITPTSAKQLL
ncbi:pyridoxamine 5'-phosphate oxidase family protein [Secundilactobacillus mixtipabuli]|uniref:FMN-binding protein n=1 Tax=Secundilactobacillus mixtipabuli TaxID=1435342 RepID=A0A1Z5IEB5_9LACO|nr:pyridoxamine 5'-phosphate oxidase family protein [Secundilactobacillus mixtipabuli]GAW99997.1 FMN-binding protein [Secundilactobacillus mixtipabuli]